MKLPLLLLLTISLFGELKLDKYSSFYLTKSGKMIMDPITYTEGIKQFLRCEDQYIFSVLADYDILFEIGCARAERAERVAQCGYNFYGIDINQEYIDYARDCFRWKNLDSHATATLFSANDLTPATFPISPYKRALIVFPFNLLGNLQDFHIVLENMLDIGQDFCFSTYKFTDQVRKSRMHYYKSCGCQQIRYSTTPIGDLFDSEDGLHSAAFRVGYIVDIIIGLLENKGKTATVTVTDLDHVGYIVHIKHIRTF
jgi:SAM-dependent methyltransferase